jgi:hypothetical protein
VNEEANEMNKQRKEQGYVLVMVVVGLVVIMGFGAFSVDLGFLYHTRGQLQKAADLSALAGANAIITIGNNPDRIEAVAREYADKNLRGRQEPVINVDLSLPNEVEVTVSRAENLFFGPVLGRSESTVSAVARARVSQVCATSFASGCLLPVTIPANMDEDGNVIDYTLGDRITLQLGSPSNATEPGFYQPIALGGRGGANYRENISNTECNEVDFIEIGDELHFWDEPGRMVGPTKQGFEALIAKDPQAEIIVKTDGTYEIVNSQDSSLPRVRIVPVYDPKKPPESGRNTLILNSFAVIFVESVTNQAEVTGIFIKGIANIGDFPVELDERCDIYTAMLVRDSSR